MARGAGETDVDSILYGSTPARNGVPCVETNEDGVVEHFDSRGELYKIEIPRFKRHPLTSISNNCVVYIKDQQIHRDDGPAVVFKNGTKRWYRHGQMCNKDGSDYFSSPSDKNL